MEERQIVLLVVYVNTVLYGTCYQIQRPLEPFLVESLISGNAADEYARLQSFFSVMQTIGCLFTGYFLDRVGVRAGFLVTYAASGFSYYLLSQSNNIAFLYISKIPTILQAGYLVGQLAVSQVTYDGSDRLTALGRLTMSYTIGCIIGPSVGGWLGGSGDYFFAARIAVAGSIISIVLTLLLLPTGEQDTVSSFVGGRRLSNADLLESIEIVDNKQLSKQSLSISSLFGMIWLLLATKVITSLANSVSATTMPVILKDNYHMNEFELGFAMSSMSAFNAIVNGLLLGPITQSVDGKVTVIIEGCLYTMTGILVLQTVLALPEIASRSLYGGLVEYMLLLFLLNMLQFMLATALTGESTSRVGPNSKGTLLGMEHSSFAAARILTPQVGINLLRYGGISCVSGVCACVFIFVCLAWKSFRYTLTIPQSLSKNPLISRVSSDDTFEEIKVS